MTNQNTTRPIGFAVMLTLSCLVFAGVFAYALVTSMSEETKRTIGIVAVCLLTMIPLTWGIAWIVTRKPNPPLQTMRVISAEPRPMPRLPAPSYDDDDPIVYRQQPERIFLPHRNEHGKRTPYGMPDEYRALTRQRNTNTPPKHVIIETHSHDGKLEIDLHILRRFIECNTPARAEWSGDKNLYGKCAKFCLEQGLLERLANGGYQWAEGCDATARIAWIENIT